MQLAQKHLLKEDPHAVIWQPVHQVKAEKVHGPWWGRQGSAGAQLQQCCGWMKLLPAAGRAGVGQWRLPGYLQAALLMVQAAVLGLHGTGQCELYAVREIR